MRLEFPATQGAQLVSRKKIKIILKQSCSGTILTAINKDEFLKIPLPLINPKTQSQISLLIQESFALKSKSEKLLELAKKAVEMAIEESEEEAMKFINQQFYSN